MPERIDLTGEMGCAPVRKLIWKMSLPSIAGMMAYNVYNLFDTFFISQWAGLDALGGVAVSFPLFLFLSAISSTLGGGAASVMSRAFGEKDLEQAAKAAGNTMGLFYMTAIPLWVWRRGYSLLSDITGEQETCRVYGQLLGTLTVSRLHMAPSLT